MRDLSRRYPVWLCDVWGVVHNGYVPFPTAVDALSRHRGEGGTVILVTNSPRTSIGVEQQLDEIGVARASHDAVVTSGDATRGLVRQHGGGKVFHLGPGRDHSFFHGMDAASVPFEQAHAVLCTGLFDDQTDRLEDYEPLLDRMKRQGLAMICANPDKLVRKGDRLLYCAGTLAEMYQQRGGEVLMAGKPYPPIYALALSKAAGIRGASIDPADVLAIGDGPETDIRGAAEAGFDALLVAEGVTDASQGLEATEASVRKTVPGARIVRTVRTLVWE